MLPAISAVVYILLYPKTGELSVLGKWFGSYPDALRAH